MKCNVILLVAGLMMLGCGKSAEEEATGPSGAGDEKGGTLEKRLIGTYINSTGKAGERKLVLLENGLVERENMELARRTWKWKVNSPSELQMSIYLSPTESIPTHAFYFIIEKDLSLKINKFSERGETKEISESRKLLFKRQ